MEDHVQMKIDRQDGPEGSGKVPRKPWQAKPWRDRGEQDRLDQRKTEARHKMKSHTTPPGFSLDGESARQPPDERGKKSPGKCGRQPDYQIAAARLGLDIKDGPHPR
jgi:hypothetical protein